MSAAEKTVIDWTDMQLAKDTIRTAQNPVEITFTAVFNEHWERVCGVLFRLVGDRDEAEDLALETFIRLHDRLPKLNQPEAIGGWLYRVAVNQGLNALRSSQRRRRYEDLAGVEALQASAPPDPEGQVEKDETRRQVRQTLSRLRPRSTQLLVLQASGLSYAEISAAVGVPVGSVGTLLSRAQKEFFERFSREFGE